MDKVKYHIPQFIMGVLFGLLVIVAIIYLSGIGDKIDKIYSILDTSSTPKKTIIVKPDTTPKKKRKGWNYV